MVLCRRIFDRNLRADSLAILLCLIFLTMCLTFATKLNLWGDEAFSLALAESSWQTIFHTVDTHLPTYTFLLKLLISLTGANANREVLIRMLHAVPFAIGLFLGYRTVGLVTRSRTKALDVLLAAIFLPPFIFYATNIRMYSLLFLSSMVFINTIAHLLSKPDLGRLNRYQNYSRYLALPYVLKFCQAVDIAGNTLFSGIVALSSIAEHTPCNNA